MAKSLSTSERTGSRDWPRPYDYPGRWNDISYSESEHIATCSQGRVFRRRCPSVRQSPKWLEKTRSFWITVCNTGLAIISIWCYWRFECKNNIVTDLTWPQCRLNRSNWAHTVSPRWCSSYLHVHSRGIRSSRVSRYSSWFRWVSEHWGRRRRERTHWRWPLYCSRNRDAYDEPDDLQSQSFRL